MGRPKRVAKRKADTMKKETTENSETVIERRVLTVSEGVSERGLPNRFK